MFEIFLLELNSMLTSSTMAGLFGGVEKHLIDDDRMRVDVTFGQFLNQSFRLVQREKLRNTNTNERRQRLNEKTDVEGERERRWACSPHRILELFHHFSNDFQCFLQFVRHQLGNHLIHSEHRGDLDMSLSLSLSPLLSPSLVDRSRRGDRPVATSGRVDSSVEGFSPILFPRQQERKVIEGCDLSLIHI